MSDATAFINIYLSFITSHGSLFLSHTGDPPGKQAQPADNPAPPPMAPLSPFLRFLTLILLNVPALHALEEESQGQPLEAFSRPVQPAVPRPRPRAKGATTTTTSTTGSLLRRARTTPIGADWTTTVSLGASGAQRIRLLIDTGSSLLWVLSAFQPAEQLHEDYADNSIYNASASPSWKPIRDLELEAFYGDGSYGARGLVGYERVALGNVSATMPVGAANETVGTLLGPEDDGILGLGFGGRDSSTFSFVMYLYMFVCGSFAVLM